MHGDESAKYFSACCTQIRDEESWVVYWVAAESVAVCEMSISNPGHDVIGQSSSRRNLPSTVRAQCANGCNESVVGSESLLMVSSRWSVPCGESVSVMRCGESRKTGSNAISHCCMIAPGDVIQYHVPPGPLCCKSSLILESGNGGSLGGGSPTSLWKWSGLSSVIISSGGAVPSLTSASIIVLGGSFDSRNE